MRVDLGDDPAVISMAESLDLAEDEIVGKLHKLWSWADRHATNGFAAAITPRWVDKYVSHSGFSIALQNVKWIEFSDSGVTFPNFDKHNGKSAKTRCDAATRQRLSRKERDNGVTGNQRDGIPKPYRRVVYERDSYTCAYCGEQSSKEIELSKSAKLSIDHIIPATRGGRSSIENLLTCCKDCNGEKNDRTPEEWGLIPTFLSDGVTYVSQKICDTRVTLPLQKPLPEKRREEKIVVLSKDNTLPENQGKQKSKLQLRVEKLMNRRPTTNMDSSESRAYKAALPVIKQTTEDDWQALEEYYRSDVSYKRMSLATLLNNWNGEIERARAHKENGGKPRQMTFGVKSISRDDRHPNELKEETDLSTLPVWDAMKDK